MDCNLDVSSVNSRSVVFLISYKILTDVRWETFLYFSKICLKSLTDLVLTLELHVCLCFSRIEY